MGGSLSLYGAASGDAVAVSTGGDDDDGGTSTPGVSTEATKITRTSFSGNLATSDDDDFEDVADMISAPTNWTYAEINFGADSATGAGSGALATIQKAEFDGWVVADAAASPIASNGVHFRDFPSNSAAAVTGFGRDIFIGKDADDKFIFAFSNTDRDAYPVTVTFVYEETVTVTGGAGGGVGGWINEKDTYEDADVGKYLVDHDGQIKRVDRSYEAGHVKTVGGVTTPGDFYDIPPDDEGGGPGQHFRGWHVRGNQVVSPNPVLGDFFSEPTYGGFESYHDGTGAGSGWRAYNPFEVGNYWADSVTIGADTVTVVGRGFNDADTIEQAFNRTDEAGEVFVISSARRIVISKVVVDAAAEHTRIEPRVWVQDLTARANPIAIFYAGSQTEKLPDTLVDRSAWKTGNSIRIQFSEEGPDETYFGGENIGLIAPIRTVTANISLLTGEAIAPARPIIRFPHGLFRVRAVAVMGVPARYCC